MEVGRVNDTVQFRQMRYLECSHHIDAGDRALSVGTYVNVSDKSKAPGCFPNQ